MNRGLAIIAAIGIILLGALILILAVFTSLKYNAKEDAVCYTPGCVHTASKILENMNSQVDPCDDFYEFACGGFGDSTVIPDDRIRVDTFSVVEDKLYEQLRASIEEESGPGEPRTVTLTKNFYRTCMNTSVIEKAGVEPLRKVLRQLGGWPVLEGDNWMDDGFNWTKSVCRFTEFGFSPDSFMTFGVNIEWTNGTKNMLMFDQASLDLSREYLIKGLGDKIVKAYYDFMVDIAVLLGADRQRATEELRESLDFEIQLANISLPEENRRDFTLLNNPMTIAELGRKFPSVNWKAFINEILPPSVRVGDDEVIMVLEPTFITGLEKLVRNTPIRVQANYALWRVAAASINYLSENIRKIQLDYSRALNGKTESKARWQECIDIVSEKLPISSGALYIKKYFKQDAKENAVEMVADIRKEFTKILKKSEWMDEKTRSRALEKAASMSSHIAYPDELLDEKTLEEYYAPLELRPNDFIGNIQNLNLFHMKYAFEKLKKPVNKSEWLTHGRPAIVNAFYMLTENSIQIPAGILQGTFFNNDRPRYMNYGAIGFVIGHEITHGFDDKGRQFDKEGNLVDWWAPETKKKYLEKAECIIYQYGNYTMESVGLKLNGVNTQGENIADNGGIEVAYKAYKEWVKRNGPEAKLPGLKYTPEQMFWIGAANTWCVKYRPEALKHYITTEVHSPGQYRVLGPFSNMPEFTADFNCPSGSSMNRERKCSVW